MALTITRTEEEGTIIRTSTGETVVGITPETPQAAVDKFVELAKANEEEIEKLCAAAEVKREWNFNERKEGRSGKDWPEFRHKERFLQKLLDQAGVIDS